MTGARFTGTRQSDDIAAVAHGARATPPGPVSGYSALVFVRQLIFTPLFVAVTALSAAACTVHGAGTTTECKVEGCTITFERGVDAKASVLGLQAELVAVEGNQVTLSVGGQKVTVPVGESGSTDNGATIKVREVTDDQVIVDISTGIHSGN